MDTPKAFTVALSAYSALALLSILKSLKNEPRPFHVYDITPSKCWLEYGNPSGHSLLTSCLYLTFWQMLCMKKGWYKGSKEYNLSFSFSLFGILIIAISRIYHGVHTFN
jgi:membrane-associated phospholipid phosphatase